MERENGLGIKIWLEKHSVESNAKGASDNSFDSQCFKLSATSSKILQKYLKSSDQSWPSIIASVWGVLLAKLSTAEFITIGVSEGSHSPCTIKMVSKLCHTNISIKDDATLHQIIKKTNHQLNKRRQQPLNSAFFITYSFLN